MHLSDRHLCSKAYSKAVLELARFYERQYEAVNAQTHSTSFEELRSVRLSCPS